jgi:hypothetical protein
MMTDQEQRITELTNVLLNGDRVSLRAFNFPPVALKKGFTFNDIIEQNIKVIYRNRFRYNFFERRTARKKLKALLSETSGDVYDQIESILSKYSDQLKENKNYLVKTFGKPIIVGLLALVVGTCTHMQKSHGEEAAKDTSQAHSILENGNISNLVDNVNGQYTTNPVYSGKSEMNVK